ncbi:MAG: hypothetical protein ABSG68_21090 [Thermoguttaceae bacterium]|jgi:hypothetical protein
MANHSRKIAEMASLQKKADGWYCQFYYHGKRHTFSVGKVSEDEANADQAGYLLMRPKQTLLHPPPGMDIVTFASFDGKPRKRPMEIPRR